MTSWHGTAFLNTSHFVRGIHRSQVKTPHKGPVMCRLVIFSFFVKPEQPIEQMTELSIIQTLCYWSRGTPSVDKTGGKLTVTEWLSLVYIHKDYWHPQEDKNDSRVIQAMFKWAELKMYIHFAPSHDEYINTYNYICKEQSCFQSGTKWHHD